MRKLALSLVVMITLAGCGSETPKQPLKTYEAKEVKIFDKIKDVGFKRTTHYYVTLEKSGEQLKLETSEDVYKAVTKGLTVDVVFDEEMVIKKITYTKFNNKIEVK